MIYHWKAIDQGNPLVLPVQESDHRLSREKSANSIFFLVLSKKVVAILKIYSLRIYSKNTHAIYIVKYSLAD